VTISQYTSCSANGSHILPVEVKFCQYKSCSANISHILPVQVIFCQLELHSAIMFCRNYLQFNRQFPVSVNLQGLIKKKSRLWKRFTETRNPQMHKVRNDICKQTRLIIKKNSVKLQNNANIIQRNFGNMLTVRQENKLELVILNLMVVMEIFR